MPHLLEVTEFSQANLATPEQVTERWTQLREQLTDGLTHDVNNLISGIHALIEALRFEAAASQSMQEALGTIQGNALKARELMQRIVELHRSNPGTRVYVDLNELAGNTIELMRKAVPGSLPMASVMAIPTLAVYVDKVAFTRATVAFTFALATDLVKGSKLHFETHYHARLPCGVEVNGESHAGPGVSLTVKTIHPAASVRTMNASPAREGWIAFARSHGGCVQTRETSATQVAYTLFLPEADLTRAHSLNAV